MTMTWVRGRELATVTKGSDTISYTYGESGLRISKTVNGVVHEYIYDGDLLISEQFGDTLLIYVYDEAGSPIGFKYRTTGYAIGAFDSYVFEKNLQGDIIAIYNTSGTSVATYKYDAWGNVISATGAMASVNPFRYRGYYYDTETGFYYLQSRYYDPAIGRFINADSISNLGSDGSLDGYNLYVYCSNNPIMYVDPNGTWSWKLFADIVVNVVAVVAAVEVFRSTGNVVAAVATFSTVNNVANSIYYDYISDGESDLASDSYSMPADKPVEKHYINRWDRLDYAKKQTKETGGEHYNVNAWRYYSEYSLHMYGWFVFADIYDPKEENIASSLRSADIDPKKWDQRPEVVIGTVLIGFLGI